MAGAPGAPKYAIPLPVSRRMGKIPAVKSAEISTITSALARILAGQRRVIMGTRGKTTEPPQILTGWKEIARHMGRGVRTVQRYERELGLPIRRPAGRQRGSVVATKSELGAWVGASPIREAFHLAKSPPDFPARDIQMVRLRLEEMRALREQMWALRNELKASLTLLTESIAGLHGGLMRNQLGTVPPIMGETPEISQALEWFSTEIKRRKTA